MRAGQRVQLTARAIRADEHLGPLYFAPYIDPMCGRVVQASEPLRYAFVDGLAMPDSRIRPPSYNVAPSQELYVIRENHKTGERTLDLLRWGLIPHECKDLAGGRKPINARTESVASLLTFRAAYAKRRCIVPGDSFFEWRAIKGAHFEEQQWKG
jgi:putative SOS response-associated peptidase YedK